jgi:hypothetical protein
MKSTINKIGSWSAYLSAAFGILYSIPQILSAVSLISHPTDLYYLFIPSLFLAPAFLVTMICLHYIINPEEKIFTAIAISFAVLYTAQVSLVYFTQLAVVLPMQLKGEINETHPLIFEGESFMVAVDCIGYGFMSISTFFASFAFANNTNQRWLYRGMLLHGVLAPFIIGSFFIPSLLAVGALWMITFPIAMINAGKFFNQGLTHGFKEGQFIASS